MVPPMRNRQCGPTVGPMRPPSLRSRFLVPLLAVLAGLTAAGPASAAITVTYSGTTATITGVGDNVTYVGFTTTYDPNGTVTIRDGVMTNATGGACVSDTQPVLGTTIHCPAATTTVQAAYGAGNDRFLLEGVCVPNVIVALGDGSNSFEQHWTDGCPASTTANVTGGSGADLILGGVGNDTLDGGGGPDTVLGGGGDDKLNGGAGNDLLDGGEGNDVVGDSDPNGGADDMRGGPGVDEIWFVAHAPGISVTLDGLPNDGSAGEGDNVHADFERYMLSPGDDVFVGSAAREYVDGWSGNDVLRGGGGDDELRGDTGDDQLFGEAGADLLIGGGGNDLVDGGPGLDTLFGDEQACSAYSCPAGADRIMARDAEVDAANCGAGADIAVVDTIDVVAGDGFQACESVDRAAPPAGGGGGGGGGGKAVTPAAFSKAKVTGARRAFTLRLTLRKAATVTVTVTRNGSRKALGAVRYKARKGSFSRTIRKVRGKSLRRGGYRVVVKAGGKTQTLKVTVR